MAIFHPEMLGSALFPTFFIYRFLATGIIANPARRAKRILGLIYCATTCVLYVIAVIFSSTYVSVIANQQGSIVACFAYHIFQHLKVVLIICNVIYSTVRYREHHDCVTELMEINTAMRTVDIIRSNQFRFMHRIWEFIGSIFVLCVIFLSYTASRIAYSTIFDAHPGLIELILQYHFFISPFFMSAFSNLAFCIFNRTLTRSLKDLNLSLESMRIKHPDDYNIRLGNLIRIEAVLKDKQKLEKLQHIRKFYHRLVNLAKRWTEVNGFIIIVSIVFAIYASTIQCYKIYRILFDPKYHSVQLVNAVYALHIVITYILELYILIYPTTAMVLEARRTGEILVTHLQPIAYLRSEVHEFSLQLIQNPLCLYACGLFELDYSVICTVVTTVATYLIVLVQARSVRM